MLSCPPLSIRWTLSQKVCLLKAFMYHYNFNAISGETYRFPLLCQGACRKVILRQYE